MLIHHLSIVLAPADEDRTVEWETFCADSALEACVAELRAQWRASTGSDIHPDHDPSRPGGWSVGDRHWSHDMISVRM